SNADWDVTVIDARPLPASVASPPDGGAPPELLLPEGIGLMPSLALKDDGTPAIAYYDRTRGNLRYIAYDPMMTQWLNPIILDGEAFDGSDTGDVGLYPSLIFDSSGIGHISYVDATRDNLLYVDTMSQIPEVVDDGYRPNDEKTQDGLPSPVFHLVGDSSSIG